MNVVTPMPSVMVGASLDVRGFHRERLEMKYAIPYVFLDHCVGARSARNGRFLLRPIHSKCQMPTGLGGIFFHFAERSVKERTTHPQWI